MSATMFIPLHDVRNLEIQAVVFATMTAMCGMHFVLFILALVLIHKRTSRSYKNLRIVAILIFITNMLHLVCRSFDIARAHVVPQPADELYRWTLPLQVFESLTSTTAAFLSDGLLAYRFYVIYGRKRWALYIPSLAVIVTGVLGTSFSLVMLAIYRRNNDLTYAKSIYLIVLKMHVTWAWMTFCINTSFTVAILLKILRATRVHKMVGYVSSPTPYPRIMEAVVESALFTWVGLLFYQIASLAPEGHYTTNFDIGYLSLCIIPFFFGISQCLIIVRLGMVAREGPTTEATEVGSSSNGVSRGVDFRGAAQTASTGTDVGSSEQSISEKGALSTVALV